MSLKSIIFLRLHVWLFLIIASPDKSTEIIISLPMVLTLGCAVLKNQSVGSDFPLFLFARITV